MKNQKRLFYLAALVLAGFGATSLRAEDTLWNLTFKDLKAGQAPAEVPFAAPCSGPQKVTTDAQNTLLGGKAVGTITTPLIFDKESTSHYMPALTLKGTDALKSGVVTVNLAVAFDHVNPNAARPVETLMAFPFINGDGGSTFIVLIGCSSAQDLFVGGAGIAKGNKSLTFKTGDVAHLKFVLDLNAHTFQVFLGDVPLGDPEHDDSKFSSFLGFTVRDGTALGGNNGATFSAALGNIVITHS